MPWRNTSSTSINACSSVVLRSITSSSRSLGIVINVSTQDHARTRSEEHTSELQSPDHLVCRLLLEKKKNHVENITFLALLLESAPHYADGLSKLSAALHTPVATSAIHREVIRPRVHLHQRLRATRR